MDMDMDMAMAMAMAMGDRLDTTDQSRHTARAITTRHVGIAICMVAKCSAVLQNLTISACIQLHFLDVNWSCCSPDPTPVFSRLTIVETMSLLERNRSVRLWVS